MCFPVKSESKLVAPIIDKDVFSQQVNELSLPLANLMRMDEAVQAISKLALAAAKGEESFYNLPTRVNRTEFGSIQGLSSLTHLAKILVFKGDHGKVDVCFAFRAPPSDDERQLPVGRKKFGNGVMIRCDLLKPENTQFVKIGYLSSAILNIPENKQAIKRYKRNYEQETSMLRELEKVPGVVRLFHAAQYEKKMLLESGEKVPCIKQRLIEERYFCDAMNYTINTFDRSSDDNQSAIAEAFIKLLLPLGAMERKRVFHGDIKPGNILVRLEKEKGADALKPEFAYCDLAFSSKYGRRDRSIRLHGLTELYASYDTFKELAEIGKGNFRLKKNDGRSDDLWSLGCTFFCLLNSTENKFSLFQIRRMTLSKMSKLAERFLNKINKHEALLADAAEPADAQSSAVLSCVKFPKLPHGGTPQEEDASEEYNNSYSMTELSEFEKSSEEIYQFGPVPLERYKPSQADSKNRIYSALLSAINRELVSVEQRLDEIDPYYVGSIFDLDPDDKIGDFVDVLDELIDFMNTDFLSDRMLDELLSGNVGRELMIFYKNILHQFIDFNKKYQEKIDLAAEVLENADPREEWYERLIQRMMHPDPKKRITTKEALKELSKAYPKLYKKLSKR